jgi:hypothetical protein
MEKIIDMVFKNIIVIAFVIVVMFIAIHLNSMEGYAVSLVLIVASLMTKIPDTVLWLGSMIVLIASILTIPLLAIIIVVGLVISIVLKHPLTWTQDKLNNKLDARGQT